MQKHYIIGTAGHIDHGKTTLTKVLTGVDTDRLKEEKERNITIELGFAPLTLPNGMQISLIDVPGHEKFIRHMVAGVGGIDLVLLVIAADEGVMPQTKEHLQIIELMGIKHGIIVLTKTDLVDSEFSELVKAEVQELIANTSLKDSPIIEVSGRTNKGINDLKETIANQLSKLEERSNHGFFKMPIDRVFTLKGIGTVVTGTIYSGTIKIGEEMEILPDKKVVRVRNIQVHSQNTQQAFAGQRAAINLTGIEINDISRGDTIVSPNQWKPSFRIDVELKLLPTIEFNLKQDSEVKLHIGTSEIVSSIILYDRKEAAPGETIYAQIKLKDPIISSPKERFIIRRPSPSITIGGGTIIEPNAVKHRYQPETIKELKQKSKGTAADLLLHQLEVKEQIFLTLNELANLLILPEVQIKNELAVLIEDNKVLAFSTDINYFYVHKLRIKKLEQRIKEYLEGFHQKFPLRKGLSKAEFIKLFLDNLKFKIINEILKYWEEIKFIKVTEEYVSLYNFNPSLPKLLQEKAIQLENKLIEQGLSPDNWNDLNLALGINETEQLELYNYLINQGKIIKLTDKMVIHQHSYEKLKTLITDYLIKAETISLQEAKDILQISRKYLIPLMELLDQKKVTVLRQGQNYRELRKKST